MLGGSRPIWAPKLLFDLFVEARDQKGNAAWAATAVNSDPLGENVILRLDKAIYKGGESMKVDIRSSAGLPTVYLDVIRNGQTLLTSWLDVKDGKAEQRLDLPANVFGTLEIHAYQMLAAGDIIRDSRVVYVHTPGDLKIAVKADKDEYLPGKEGKIRFQVTNAKGEPTPAALGVIIVDEAVYALQEMQPGLEKVYFTLQEELIKPQAQVVYRPNETIDTLVRRPELAADKQQIAQVLLTAVKPKPPARWEVVPDIARRQNVEGQVQQIGLALHGHAVSSKQACVEYDKTAKRWKFRDGLLDELVKAQLMEAQTLTDPFGKKWTLAELGKLEKGFSPDRLARGVTRNRMSSLAWALAAYTQANQAKWLKDGKWNLPETVLADALSNQKLPDLWLKDGWGQPMKLVKLDKKREHLIGGTIYDFHELVSAGSDGKFGTADDMEILSAPQVNLAQWWWLEESRQAQLLARGDMLDRAGMRRAMKDGMAGGFGGARLAAPGMAPMTVTAGTARMPDERKAEAKAADKSDADPKTVSGGAAPSLRVREYFPETMLWKPALITNDKGQAELMVDFADSITTWRSAPRPLPREAPSAAWRRRSASSRTSSSISTCRSASPKTTRSLSRWRSTTTSKNRRPSKLNCRRPTGSS